MDEITVETGAYAKMILHAVKYPHCAVNGVLLSEAKSRDNSKSLDLEIVDSVPLFHHSHYVSPMAEIAMIQIEAAAQSANLVISGYYAASDNYFDKTIAKCPGQKLAEKIAKHFPNAVYFLIDNYKLFNSNTPALKVFQNIHDEWVQKDDNRVLFNDVAVLNIVTDLVSRGVQKELIDYDNHLDDLTQDWSNQGLDKLIKTVSGPAEARLRKLLEEGEDDDEDD